MNFTTLTVADDHFELLIYTKTIIVTVVIVW